jgi:anti-anti-sigma factor
MAVSLPPIPALSSTPYGVDAVPQIQVFADETPAELVVRVTGEASFRLADDLAIALLRLSARRPQRIALDLSGLSFVSSLAMGVLVTFRRAVVRAGRRVRLAGSLQEPVREALARAELLPLFDWPTATASRETEAA